MDLEGAIRLLRAHGLVVRTEPGPSLTAVADPCSDSHDPGVEHRFSASIRQAGHEWVLQVGSDGDATGYPGLEDAVRGATQEFCEYRNFHSPRVYGDQFARFIRGPVVGY